MCICVQIIQSKDAVQEIQFWEKIINLSLEKNRVTVSLANGRFDGKLCWDSVQSIK